MKLSEVKDRNYLKLGDYINEGKTKAIFNLTCRVFKDSLIHVIGDAVGMVFKNDITAGDGVKHDVIEGKALLDWQVNRDIYEYLNRKGIQTHHLFSTEPKITIVKKLDKKINLEVVTRRIATGSILKHTDYKEGYVFMPVLSQFFYKDDLFHDPLLDQKFIDHIRKNKNFYLYHEMIAANVTTFIVLEEAFAKFNIQLVDIKLEYGIVDGKLTLIDEITGGSFRLWPYAGDSIDLSRKNVFYQLNPKGRLDKDLYRKGEASLDGIRNKFQEIADITIQFKDLK